MDSLRKDLGVVKLIDVAKAANCSPATVSRVLNGNPAVGQQIRAQVIEATRDLGYVPNGSARALRSTKTRLVGAIIPTLDHAIYATMVDSLQARLAEKNVSLIISTSSYDIDLEYEQARLLIERGVKFVIVVGSHHRPKTLALLEKKSIPCVFTSATGSDTGAAIGFDNEKAGRIAARYLLDLGHTRLGMIAGVTQDNDRARGRRDGFLQEIARTGLDPTAAPVVEGTYKTGSGRRCMAQLMNSRSAQPPYFVAATFWLQAQSSTAPKRVFPCPEMSPSLASIISISLS